MLQKSWRFASEVDMQDKGPVGRNLLNILGTNGSQRQNLHPYSFIKFFFFAGLKVNCSVIAILFILMELRKMDSIVLMLANCGTYHNTDSPCLTIKCFINGGESEIDFIARFRLHSLLNL